MTDMHLPPHERIDLDGWPRAPYFSHYLDGDVSFTATCRLDASAAMDVSRATGRKFSAWCVHAVTRAVNAVPGMRVGLVEGRPVRWERLEPQFTVFDPMRETFSSVWAGWRDDYPAFEDSFRAAARDFAASGVPLPQAQVPPNVFDVSIIPGLGFDSFSLDFAGGPHLAPIVTIGQYRHDFDGGSDPVRTTMPVSVRFHHAAVDGYHASLFFDRLQQELDR